MPVPCSKKGGRKNYGKGRHAKRKGARVADKIG